ncbi:exopolyphosphatase [Methylocapsa sp. S129]|uniref:exopolyphosphatase n=1 Tax=Methylocapsa sp. S129 TaxID=1641869 RepID=UPI00131D7A79|nr:exopolyphosphatase [Methylocapsa sp. S129]
MPPTQFRLVTRSDFDGLVCGVLLKELNLIDEITFVHPKDMQDGKVAISGRDIITNLPYVDGCHLAFDHHSSELDRGGGEMPPNHIIDPDALSAARVVYRYFGGQPHFPGVREDIMRAVDKADSAQFTGDEILRPQGWAFLSFLMDSRTGLGRFRQFRISNYELMMQLIDRCRTHTVEEILESPDVKERVDLYRQHDAPFREQVLRCARVYRDLVVLDLRQEETIYAGNRFMIYALFPQCRVSMHVLWGVKQQNTVFAIGKSIIDRGSPIDVGSVCLSYGGGGHEAAGTCQVDNARAADVMAELIGKLAVRAH